MRYIITVTLLLLASTSFAATWTQIAGTDLVEDGPIYDWSPNSVPGTYGGITAWSGAAFDSMNTRLLLNGYPRRTGRSEKGRPRFQQNLWIQF